MSRIVAISLNTFREAVRDRVLYSILFFAVAMMGLSMALDNLTIGDQAKVVRSFAQGAIDVFGAIIAMFLGISLVWKELERKTIYNVLSKPLHRWAFVLGKYLGLVLTLVVEVALLAAVYTVLFGIMHGIPASSFYLSMGLLVVELMLLTAWATLFSCYSSPTTAAAFTLSIFVIGHLADDIWLFGQQAATPQVRQFSEILYWCLPNFEVLSIRDLAVHERPVPLERVGAALVYGLSYSAAVLAAAVAVFQQKDVK